MDYQEIITVEPGKRFGKPCIRGRLSRLYPDSAHVENLGLGEADDSDIWHYALSHEFMIVTKDVDYFKLSLQYGSPPKVIWLTMGNCPTDYIESTLRDFYQSIVDLYDDPSKSSIALT